MRLRRSRFGAPVLALALVAGACGGDDTDGAASPSDDETSAAVARAVIEQSGADTVVGPSEHPDTMEEWEALWAEERDAVVARIRDNGWGTSADGSTATGPGGFTIDLTACPGGWNNTEGLTDTEIHYGYLAPLSGPVAEAGGIGRAHEALFAYYNQRGGFTDSNGKTRQVLVTLRDDGYDPARSIPLVDELIDSAGVFILSTTGTPSTMRTYGKLNERCIPQVLPATGHPAFGDPVNHPWTTSSSISYTTEAMIWGSFIEQRLDEFGGTVKVASIRMNNDFGASYHAAFEAFLAQSPHRSAIEYTSEVIEPTAVTVKDEMTTVASRQPDVFLGMSTGVSCSQFITEAAENGMKEEVDYKFLSSACKATTPVTRDALGEMSDGWWTVGGGLKDITISAYDDDAFIVAARAFIADAGMTPTPSFNLGLFYGWALSQGIQIAGELDGGLNRSNLIVALRTMQMTNPMLLPGIGFGMSGNDDGYFLEGSDISYWDAADQTWVQESVVNIPGRTPLCAWNQATSRCG